MQQREKQTNDIIYYGLWQSKERLETALEEITEEQEKRIAIQAQLRFRQKMLKQKHEQKDILRFSAKGKGHPISKLKENLLNLIESAYHGPTTESVKQKNSFSWKKGETQVSK